jgi:hypothetical protein
VFIKASEWTAFELAYYDLALFTTPVTAETLRNTEQTGYRFYQPSEAQRFTWVIWLMAFAFIAGVLTSAYIVSSPAAELDPPPWFVRIAKLLIPWAYGGLGACAYMLRSAHTFMYQRCFDVRRKPEYLNRIFLGAISGGAVVVLIDELAGDSGTTVRLSASALGFIAGYSTDFLFNAVERIVAAILPRVGLESVQRAAPVAARPALDVPGAGLTLKELLDRMHAAEIPEDKELYRALIEKIKDRL